VSRGRAAWLPTPRHLLLLRACLWQGEEALTAWSEWRGGEPDLAKVERGSLRLLPLLYRNLGPRLAGDPDAGWLRDVYRISWTTNQLGLRVGRRAIDALQATGTEVLALKGAALVGAVYGDLGARPMGDVDLAVPPPRIGEAVRALQGAGLTAVEGDPESLLAARHSLAFRDPGGREVDLHRGMLWHPALDEEFWRGSVGAEVAGARVRILNPADQILHVCAHGAAWNPVHPVRWAADAFKAIEAGGPLLDWQRLAAMARRGRLATPIAEALDVLAEDLDAPVPEDIRAELSRTPVSRAERRAHEALAGPPSSRRSVAMLSWFRERHRAQAELDGERARLTGFVRYMQGFWGLDRPSQVPAHAVWRLLRRRD
jgi:Uncharacterised nucleotidyltransferase